MSRKEREGGFFYPVPSTVVLRSLIQGENELFDQFKGLLFEKVISGGGKGGSGEENQPCFVIFCRYFKTERYYLYESFLIRTGIV